MPIRTTHIFRLFLLSCLLASNCVYASTINDNAIDELKSLSSFICDKIMLDGGEQTLELDGKAKAELDSILSNLANLGISGAAKYKNKKFVNVLRKDLADQLNKARECRLLIWNDMKNTIIKPKQVIKEVKSVSASINGSNNVSNTIINNSNVGNTTISNNQEILLFNDFAQAIARHDFETVRLYESKKQYLSNDYNAAFSHILNNGNYVINEFFKHEDKNNLASEWLINIIENGFNVDNKIHIGKKVTSLLWASVEVGSVEKAILLLSKGASPYSWHTIEASEDAYSRNIWPVEFVLSKDDLSRKQKKKLATALIEAGAMADDSLKSKNLLNEIDIIYTQKTDLCPEECKLDSLKKSCIVIKRYYKEYVFNMLGKFTPSSYFFSNEGLLNIRGSIRDTRSKDRAVLSIDQENERSVLYSRSSGAKCRKYRSCWYSFSFDLNVKDGTFYSKFPFKYGPEKLCTQST